MLGSLMQHFNRPLPLLDYFIPLIGDKKKVRIADIGSGPYAATGQLLDGVEVEVCHSDKRDYSDFWKNAGVTPLFKIEHQNMEKLTYDDDSFDIVVCTNALDHTKYALSAVKEMMRIVKPGGWVRIDCSLYQLDTGGKHWWNATETGEFISRNSRFDLKDLGFKIELIDLKGERRYNHIIATYQK